MSSCVSKLYWYGRERGVLCSNAQNTCYAIALGLLWVSLFDLNCLLCRVIFHIQIFVDRISVIMLLDCIFFRNKILKETVIVDFFYKLKAKWSPIK